MKRRILALAASLFAGGLFAYNPPAGGQNLQRLSSPTSLTGAGSAAGGALYEVLPASIFNNPALPAFEQRIILSAGVTALTDSEDGDGDLGDYKSLALPSLEAGLLVPSRYGVATAMTQFIMAPLIDMPLGYSFGVAGNVAKDITDQVSVGVTASFGVFWGFTSDWTLSIGLGAFYDYGDIGFLKDVRFGMALLNLGKMYNETEVLGISWSDYGNNWPGVATPRMGAAATLLDAGKLQVGCSLDLSFPSFQDFVTDIGLQVQYASFLKLATSWEYDVRECNWGRKSLLPSLGLSFKFQFHSKEDSTITKFAGGQESEMTVSGGWHQLYENVNAFSAGAVLKLGLEDRDPPVIILWED